MVSEGAEQEHQGITVRKFMLGAASTNTSIGSDSCDEQESTKNSSEQNELTAALDAVDAQEAQEQWQAFTQCILDVQIPARESLNPLRI